MALYSLADFVVDIENKYDFLTRQCVEYQYSGTAPADFTVRVSEAGILPGIWKAYVPTGNCA